jgi:hypothetical protein
VRCLLARPIAIPHDAAPAAGRLTQPVEQRRGQLEIGFN